MRGHLALRQGNPAVQIYRGEPIKILSELVEKQRQQSAESVGIATTHAVEPRLRQQQKDLARAVNVQRYAVEPFVPMEVKDLRRFSHYWNKVTEKTATARK